MDKPALHDITEAAEQAVDEIMRHGYAHLFLDHDKGKDRVKVVIDSSDRPWNPGSTTTHSTKYTETAMPLVNIYHHQMPAKEYSRDNTNAAKDIILEALDRQWDIYVGYYLEDGAGPAFSRVDEDFNWALRTAGTIHGARTISLYMDRTLDPEAARYFLWVSPHLREMVPPGAVKRVATLCTLEGDYPPERLAEMLSASLKEYFGGIDLDRIWSYDCSLYHYQYKYGWTK